MRSLTWLHLSDLHACTPKFAWDAGRVTETLVEDLRRLRDAEGLRPDLLFFTGDAAFGEVGTEPAKTVRGQLRSFAAFLEDVRTVFEPAVPLDRVFLVPGNHDTNRLQAMPEQTFWLDSQEEIEPVRRLMADGGIRWRNYMERLADYREFLKDHGLTHLLDDPERLIYSTVREIGELRVGVAGFNSAWSCCRDGERGRLWMAGQWQQGVLRSKLKDADFSIALVHHPPDWLVEYENPGFGRGLERDFRFLLHGHEHRAWVQSTDTGYTVIAAAACYERSDTEHNGYNVVRLDPASGRGEVWLRRYDAAGGWIPRIVAGRTDDRGVRELRLNWFKELESKQRLAEPPNETEAATILASPEMRSDPDDLDNDSDEPQEAAANRGSATSPVRPEPSAVGSDAPVTTAAPDRLSTREAALEADVSPVEGRESPADEEPEPVLPAPRWEPPVEAPVSLDTPRVETRIVIQERLRPPPEDNDLRLTVAGQTATLRFAGKEYSSPFNVDFGRLLEVEHLPEDYGQVLYRGVIRTVKSPATGLESTDHGYRTAMETTGRKVRFELAVDANDTRLRGLKWEVFTDLDRQPLAINERLPFYRRIGYDDVEAVEPPIRILVAICNPPQLGQDSNRILQQLSPIDVARERIVLKQGLERLADSGLATYKILGGNDEDVTWEALTAELQEGWHVLHLVAHGVIVKGKHNVVMTRAGRKLPFVGAADFGKLLRTRDVRLAVLATCDGFTVQKRGGDADGTPDVVGLGADLVVAKVPAVISMQDKLPMSAAQLFTQQFYDDLARSGRVDMALAATRFDLYQRKVGGSDSWGIPVLHLGSKSAQLFRVDEDRAAKLPLLEPTIRSAEELSAAVAQAEGRADPVAGLAGSGILAQGFVHQLRELAGVVPTRPSSLAPKQDPAAMSRSLLRLVDLNPFGDEGLKAAVEAQGFRTDDVVYSQLASALNAGKHVVLLGPPGTGKTTLAHALCAHAAERGFSLGTVPTTASADWTTFDTVGGYVPTPDGSLAFRPGIFLQAILGGKWLVIDEINRAEIDKAVGELFTVLSGQRVDLAYQVDGQPVRILPPKRSDPLLWVPDDAGGGYDYVVHPNWRIVATMNVYDKSSLFEMSFAFMRRFAFVDVGVPNTDHFAELRRGWLKGYGLDGAVPTEGRDELEARLDALFNSDKPLMRARELGPAIAKDMIHYVADRFARAPESSLTSLLEEAFLLYAVPQLDGLNRGAILEVYTALAELFAASAEGSLLTRVRSLYPHVTRDDWDEVLPKEESGDE